MPKRNYRKRQASEGDEVEDDDLKYYKLYAYEFLYVNIFTMSSLVLEETKEIQKFRKRPKGVR